MKAIYKTWSFIFSPSGSGGPFVTPQGGVALSDDRLAIRQAIMMILSTVPGERIMRPHYGCELHKVTFLPNDASTAGLAIYYIRKAIERWEKRITITTIDAEESKDDPAVLDILFSYRINRLNIEDEITFSVQLAGVNSNVN